MASPVPAKSHPLHNFSLPHLKWKKNHTTKNHHRGRSRLAESSPPPPHQSPPSNSSRRHLSPSYVSRRQSPLLDSSRMQSPMRALESESDLNDAVSIQKHKNLAGVSISSTSDHIIEKSEKKLNESKTGLVSEKGKRSKICIRFRKNKPDDVVQDENQEKTSVIEGEEDESLPKTWNLRPRRPLNKQSNNGIGTGNGNGNGGTHKVGGSCLQENKGVENKESELNSVGKKQKFSISLFREEIDEDIFALTGSKASRRPKKRPRAVQKQLDTLFPGLWLGCITPDSYKVSDAPTKG